MQGKLVRYQGQPANKTVWCVVIHGERLHVNATYTSSTPNVAPTLSSVELGGCGCEPSVSLPDNVSTQVEQLLGKPRVMKAI